MLFVALIIGAVLLVAAIRNSQGTLFSALRQDVPEYGVWAAAIVAVGAIGFIPGLKPIARGLLALVILVILLKNYSAIIAGFKSIGSGVAAPSGSNGDTATGSTGATPSVSSLGDIGSTAMSLADYANSFAGG